MDLVERQNVIDKKKWVHWQDGSITHSEYAVLIRDLYDIPSEYPERRGKWIKHDTGYTVEQI